MQERKCENGKLNNAEISALDMLDTLDTLIIGGEYPDFCEGRMKQANIGISGGKIAYIGEERPEASEIIDATGKIV